MDKKIHIEGCCTEKRNIWNEEDLFIEISMETEDIGIEKNRAAAGGIAPVGGYRHSGIPFRSAAHRRTSGRSYGCRGCQSTVGLRYRPLRNAVSGAFYGVGQQPDERITVLLHDPVY